MAIKNRKKCHSAARPERDEGKAKYADRANCVYYGIERIPISDSQHFPIMVLQSFAIVRSGAID